MQAELDALVAKLEALTSHLAHLQSDNRVLREALTRAVGERDALDARLDAARTRLKSLLDRLPEDA